MRSSICLVVDRAHGFGALSTIQATHPSPAPQAWLENRGAALTLGIVTAVIGFLKFFVRAPNDTVPVAGDLLPAIAGLAVGATLFFEALLRKPSTPERPVDRYAKAVLTYRIPLGIVCVAIALLHFLFPQAVIL
jgi:hypothetical protein